MPIPKNHPVLLAKRLDQVPKSIVLPPDVKTQPCAGCGRLVCLSPASRALVATGRVLAVCDECLPTGDYAVTMTGAQLEDLQRYHELNN